ncbi:MAG: hypothetical protein H0W15_10790 [Gemmatimonadales bacterium]|nr:hypothetical protein [Gemmatimonadales bacterium]
MRTALAGIIDYAGLFPPASCTMTRATSSYDSYRGSPDRWMLGRFIVAASRLDELGQAVDQAGFGTPVDPWPLSVVMGVNMPAELALITAFEEAWGAQGFVVDALEYKVGSAGHALATEAELPPHLTRFLEVPLHGPYEPVVKAIQRVGAYAKIRTGGTTPDLIPSSTDLLAFLQATIEHEVPFKATAGLHHPFRGQYPLTYDDDAEQATMFGFVNLLVAAAELMATGDADKALQILEEEDAGAFVRSGDTLAWRGNAYDAATLATTRDRSFLSFGSCSFREPVDELQLDRTR